MTPTHYLRDGLPEEHRVIVMRPAEAPDPTEGELADIRRALEDPEVDRLRLAVEAAGTAEGRVAALAEFNRALGEELERLADARREGGGDPDLRILSSPLPDRDPEGAPLPPKLRGFGFGSSGPGSDRCSVGVPTPCAMTGRPER